MTVADRILNFIFPPKCTFCGKLLGADVDIHICPGCYMKIPFTNLQIPLYGLLDGIVCVCEYSGIIKEAIIRYKFYNKSSYYRTFAYLLSQKVKTEMAGQEFDLIISVPLHKKRKASRGYNQSFLISRILSKELGIPEASYCLSRTRETASQSLLPGVKRYANVHEAFRVNHVHRVAGRNILLVDDVLTTGTTLNECCRVLKNAGAGKVAGAVIASGKKF